MKKRILAAETLGKYNYYYFFVLFLFFPCYFLFLSFVF